MRIMVKKTISLLLALQILLFVGYFFSKSFFYNAQVGFWSAFLIIMGASYAYRSMIKHKIDSQHYEEQRDILDEIDDKYELYDEEPVNEAPPEDLDLKAIVKEEKSKIKTVSLSSMKYGAKGGFSPWRLLPYLLLVFGFIALKNNNILSLWIYLPSLGVGVVVGSISSRELFTK